jgi:hypothetical protein
MNELQRKSVHFTANSWRALLHLMDWMGAPTPSLTIERLIEAAVQRQGSEHDHSNAVARSQ